MSIEEDQARYEGAAHAMQTGVQWELSHGDGRTFNAKHTRVGINSAHVSVEALATLLIEKGVFTLEEYTKASADAMEREVARYEEMINGGLQGPGKVTLR